MPGMAQFKFSLKDVVRKIGHQESRTVEVQMERPTFDENIYSIQLGRDAADRVLAKESELELVPRAETPDGGPGFVPTRSITG
jgi:hypothetical protein